jgi:hypothetical protein
MRREFLALSARSTLAFRANTALGVALIEDNEKNVSEETEYKAGQSSPCKTITSGLNWPAGATVNKNGELFVSNFLAWATKSANTRPAPSIRRRIKGRFW